MKFGAPAGNITPGVERHHHGLLHLARRLRETSRNNQGQNLLEFALILPVFLLMLTSIVDVGRGMQVYVVVTNAAREGARYGSLYPNDTTGIETRVRNEVGSTNVPLSNITISCPDGIGAGRPLRVEVEYQFDTILGSIINLQSLRVHRAVEMIIF